MATLSNRIRAHCRCIWYSIRSVKKLNLGDDVVLLDNGETAQLTQGVKDPFWNMVAGEIYLRDVHRSEFRKKRSIRNLVHDLRSSLSFYYGYWFRIWAEGGRDALNPFK